MRRRPLARATASALTGCALVATSLFAFQAHADPDGPPSPASDDGPGYNGPVVHLFQWTWDAVAEECADFLGEAGYAGVQVSPPQEHVVLPWAIDGDRGYDAAYPWWQDYQPVSYRIDDTRRGDAEDFQAMVDTCAEHDVRIYVDAVVNHMARRSAEADGSVTNDLNTAEPDVRAAVLRYLNKLVDMGVAGFRVDASKHVHEDELADIVAGLHNVPEGCPGAGAAPHIYHEVYGDQVIPYTAYAFHDNLVTDFTHQATVASSFHEGSIAHLGEFTSGSGLAAHEAAVFVDNHDIQRDGHSPGKELLTHPDGDRHYLATAYLLAHSHGMPVVMSSFEYQRNGEESHSPPSTYPQDDTDPDNLAGAVTRDADCEGGGTDEQDGRGWVCEHRDQRIASMVHFSNDVQNAPVADVHTDGQERLAFARGDTGYAAFNASDTPWQAAFPTPMADGTYCDLAEGAPGDAGECQGEAIEVSNGSFTATVPANGHVALSAPCQGEQCSGGEPPPPAGELTATVQTRFGDQVVATGDHTDLGDWDPRQGAQLSTEESTYPEWSGVVDVPQGTEWKLAILRADGGVDWEEEIDNRVWPGGSVTVTWNEAP